MSNKSCEDAEVTTAAMAPASPTAAAAPRGRPSWSGLLRFSLVTVPIKAYPALSTATAVCFNQLHANCGQRIKYQKHCPLHGPVDTADIVRGYQYAPGQYVVVEPEELDKVRPVKDKALVLGHFVAVHDIDPVLFAGRSLYLFPDGLAARHPYGVVAEAMHQGGKWALGHVVLSSTRQLVLIRSLGCLLVMDLLHYPAAVRAAAAWEAELHGGAGTPEERRLTSALIDAASGPLDWSRYRDATAEELAAVIEAKIASQPLATPTEEPVAVLQLLDALKQSVAAVQEQAQAVQAKPRKSRSPRRASA